MGHASEILDWRPRFCGEEVVEGELGSGDDAEAFGEMEIVCEEKYELGDRIKNCLST